MESCIVNPVHDCLGLAKAESIEKELSEHKRHSREDHKEIFERLNKLEGYQRQTETQFGQIMQSLGSLQADITNLKMKPAKRWDQIVEKIIMLVISGVTLFLLAKIGL